MITNPVILDGNGRPAIVSAERVRLEKQQRFNPLKRWTPDMLTRQLEAAARGEIRELAWVMEWIEQHDDIVQTVAPKAKAAVARHGFDVLVREGVTPAQKDLAERQRDVLQQFYANIETGHAIDQDEVGGMRLLVKQVMDGHGKGYSAHHIVWQPTAQGLRARLIFVPLWFFESTEGRLRYLKSQWDIRGVELSEMGGRDAWLISKGRGVMMACAIARMFKMIPLQDWLTYCDRHGMPAFLGKTSAQKHSPGWQTMTNAVAGIGSEFGAVINTGDTIDVLNLLAQGELPYEKLIDRMDRAMTMLWRGGDLATISRENGTGSNPQQDEQDELDGDNAVWVSETIDRQLSRTVLDWHFGKGTPALVELKIRTATRDNVTQDLATVKSAKDLGIRISKPWFISKFNIVEADAGEAALGDPAPADPGATVIAANTADASEAEIRKQLAQAMQPIGDALLDAFSAQSLAALEEAAEDENTPSDS